MEEHGHSLHREVIRVPLIITSPALPAGGTVEQYVRTIDILPTILDVVGQSARAPENVEGVTLVPTINAAGPHLPVYSEAMLYGSTERCLIDEGHKLMYDEQGDQWKLYDINADPTEAIDLASRWPQRVESMRRCLVELHARLERDYQLSQQVHPTRELEQDLREDLKALRALGYISDD
jgi:arylsulfatase A-like enzyme